MYTLRERIDAFSWSKKSVGCNRQIQPSDAGIVRECYYCGMTFEEEQMVKDEADNWVCRPHLFDTPLDPPSDIEEVAD
jgi:hypothetical protein